MTSKVRALGALAAFVACSVAASPPGSTEGGSPPVPLQIDVGGTAGHGRIEDGRSCAAGGSGEYRHYDYAGPVAAGMFSQRPADARIHLDVHHDPGAEQAFLGAHGAAATLADERGTIRLRLVSGSCPDPTLAWDGTTTSGSGTWAVERGTGAYAGADGEGGFSLNASVAPGADNPWHMRFGGELSVLQPRLKAEVLDTFWAELGVDYATRRVTVVYRITNEGPGYAFGARLVEAASPTPGVTPIGPVPQPLGDLVPGESTLVAVRYQLGLLQPCDTVILGCDFDTTVTVEWADAVDVLTSPSADVPAHAPDLPPPAKDLP